MTVGHSILLLLRSEVKINFDVVAYFPYNISFRDGVIEVDITSSATLNKRRHYQGSAGVNMHLNYVISSPPATRHFLLLRSYCCASLWSTNSLSLHINILYR
jgi:hypothetical protein